jgi:APA family basic amino acid/polyamine antiporter
VTREKEELTFVQALAIGLGNIIGAGIFVMAGASVSEAGPSAILAFLITAAYAVTIGLNSAELASVFPNTEGGVYSYALLTLGETIGFLVGFFRVVSYAISGAATALGFSGYLVSMGLPEALYFPLAGALIVVLGVIESRGLKLTSEIETALVILSVIGLLVFSVAVISISGFRPENFTPFMPNGVYGLFTASNIAFFAYAGFNTIANLTPNVKNGERTVPRAIVASIAISAILYIFVVFSMIDGLYWTKYGQASDPLALVLTSIRAPLQLIYFIDLVSVLSTVSVTLSIIVSGERTAKQMAMDGLLPPVFSRRSTLVVMAIMLASLSLGNVEAIALVSNFGLVLSYMLSGIEVWVARRRGLRGAFKSPGFPIVHIISVAMSAIFLVSLGPQSLAVGVVTLLIALAIHSVHKERKSALKTSGNP